MRPDCSIRSGGRQYFVPSIDRPDRLAVFQSEHARSGVAAAGLPVMPFCGVPSKGLTALFGGYGAIVGEASARVRLIFSGRSELDPAVCRLLQFVLLITNFTLAGFRAIFDVAWDNLRIRIDEWRARRRENRSA